MLVKKIENFYNTFYVNFLYSHVNCSDIYWINIERRDNNTIRLNYNEIKIDDNREEQMFGKSYYVHYDNRIVLQLLIKLKIDIGAFYNNNFDEINHVLRDFIFTTQEKTNEEYSLAMQTIKTQMDLYDKNVINIYRKSEENIAYFNSYFRNYKFEKHIVHNYNDPIILSVYDVGQANMSTLTYDRHIFALFDFGYSGKNGNKKAINNVYSNIDNNGIVVLSHFHQDHYNGYLRINNSYTNRYWFIQPIPNNPKSNHLMNFINWLNNNVKKIHVVRKNNKVYTIPLNKSKTDFVEILAGLGNNDNDSSLISRIKINKKYALLPGDCIYDCFPNVLKNKKIDFLCLAHHGGALNSNKIVNLDVSKSIVQCNSPYCKFGKSGHPLESHLNYVMQNFNCSTIYRFQKDKPDMMFDLNNNIVLDYLTIKITGDYFDFKF